jgi:hypothetical protein
MPNLEELLAKFRPSANEGAKHELSSLCKTL